MKGKEGRLSTRDMDAGVLLWMRVLIHIREGKG